MPTTTSPRAGACAVCRHDDLRPHLAVAGDPGPDGLIPTTDRFGTALSDIVRCARCGHMQLDRFPDAAELSEAYGDAASDDYIEEEAGQRATARATLDVIERYVARGALVDLGCWVGYLLAEARDRGWEVVGVEPSEFASGYARERLGLEVHREDLFEAKLPARQFQAVFLGDVIEHLLDPGAALERGRELLAPDGVLAIALPDAGSRLARALGRRWWSVIPTHVQYFTRASMQTLLARHGYDVLHVGTAPKVFSVRYYVGRTGGYSPRVAGALIRTAGRVGVADRLWAPDFRDRMLVVARPTAAS